MIMALLPMAAVAQSDDFGLDFSLEAQKKLSKQWSVSLEGEYRSRNNAKTNDRWSVGLNVDYKVAKWLKASAGYTLLYDNNERISYYEATDDAVLDGDATHVVDGLAGGCLPAVHGNQGVAVDVVVGIPER